MVALERVFDRPIDTDDDWEFNFKSRVTKELFTMHSLEYFNQAGGPKIWHVAMVPPMRASAPPEPPTPSPEPPNPKPPGPPPKPIEDPPKPPHHPPDPVDDPPGRPEQPPVPEWVQSQCRVSQLNT